MNDFLDAEEEEPSSDSGKVTPRIEEIKRNLSAKKDQIKSNQLSRSSSRDESEWRSPSRDEGDNNADDSGLSESAKLRRLVESKVDLRIKREAELAEEKEKARQLEERQNAESWRIIAEEAEKEELREKQQQQIQSAVKEEVKEEEGDSQGEHSQTDGPSSAALPMQTKQSKRGSSKDVEGDAAKDNEMAKTRDEQVVAAAAAAPVVAASLSPSSTTTPTGTAAAAADSHEKQEHDQKYTLATFSSPPPSHPTSSSSSSGTDEGRGHFEFAFDFSRSPDEQMDSDDDEYDPKLAAHLSFKKATAQAVARISASQQRDSLVQFTPRNSFMIAQTEAQKVEAARKEAEAQEAAAVAVREAEAREAEAAAAAAREAAAAAIISTPEAPPRPSEDSPSSGSVGKSISSGGKQRTSLSRGSLKLQEGVSGGRASHSKRVSGHNDMAMAHSMLSEQRRLSESKGRASIKAFSPGASQGGVSSSAMSVSSYNDEPSCIRKCCSCFFPVKKVDVIPASVEMTTVTNPVTRTANRFM